MGLSGRSTCPFLLSRLFFSRNIPLRISDTEAFFFEAKLEFLLGLPVDLIPGAFWSTTVPRERIDYRQYLLGARYGCFFFKCTLWFLERRVWFQLLQLEFFPRVFHDPFFLKNSSICRRKWQIARPRLLLFAFVLASKSGFPFPPLCFFPPCVSLPPSRRHLSTAAIGR